jgi:hypothetical protein
MRHQTPGLDPTSRRRHRLAPAVGLILLLGPAACDPGPSPSHPRHSLSPWIKVESVRPVAFQQASVAGQVFTHGVCELANPPCRDIGVPVEGEVVFEQKGRSGCDSSHGSLRRNLSAPSASR